MLEIGTGSGYQAAVLAALVENVYTVERIEELLRNARRRFRKLGIENLRSKHDDGKLGWPEHAPYDAIMLTAADDAVARGVVRATRARRRAGRAGRAARAHRSCCAIAMSRRRKSGWVGEALDAVSFVPLLGGLG